MIKSLGSTAMLLGVLAGCGGGSNGAAQAPAQAAAGLEEDVNAKPASVSGSAAAATRAAVKKIDPSLIPEPGAPIERESYNYVGGSRDPFASVLEGASIGPELADLDVAGIWYQKNNAASVVVLRDRVTLKRYAVREGERVGRARVAEIQEKQVTFTIDDYGTTRRVTLSLRKREDNTP